MAPPPSARSAVPAPVTFSSASPLPRIGGASVQPLSGRYGLTAAPGTNAGMSGQETLKLSNVEAQRVMTVLADVLRRVSWVASVPSTVDWRLRNILGERVAEIIQAYTDAEKAYLHLLEIERSDESIAQSNLFKTELAKAAKNIQKTTRDLCRVLSEQEVPLDLRKLHQTVPISSAANAGYPDTSNGAGEEASIEATAKFEAVLHDIKLLMYSKLKTTPDEERARQEQLENSLAKEQRTTLEVRNIREQLEKMTQERAIDVQQRNNTIKKLKDELREIKQQAEDATKKLEAKSMQKEETELEQYREKEQHIKSEVAALYAMNNDLLKKHREEELALRKKKYKIESEVDAWIQKYDQDMEERQIEIDDITVIYTEEKAQLEELQRRYDDLNRLYGKIVDERKLEEDRQQQEEAIRLRKHKAASKIQALWRGRKTRKELKAKSEKKKEGKPSKGKKKKSAKK